MTTKNGGANRRIGCHHHQPCGEYSKPKTGDYPRPVDTAMKPINARSETAGIFGMFRGALAARRCLVPAGAFYEWRPEPTGQQPYAIARTDGAPMAFAGLWEVWKCPDGEILRTFTILTTDANATMAALHQRMPVVLEPADWPVWLGEADAPVDDAGGYNGQG